MEDILAFGPSPVLVKPPWHITGTLSVCKHMATCTALLHRHGGMRVDLFPNNELQSEMIFYP